LSAKTQEGGYECEDGQEDIEDCQYDLRFLSQIALVGRLDIEGHDQGEGHMPT
jgi:hypothetical protein